MSVGETTAKIFGVHRHTAIGSYIRLRRRIASKILSYKLSGKSKGRKVTSEGLAMESETEDLPIK